MRCRAYITVRRLLKVNTVVGYITESGYCGRLRHWRSTLW